MRGIEWFLIFAGAVAVGVVAAGAVWTQVIHGDEVRCMVNGESISISEEECNRLQRLALQAGAPQGQTGVGSTSAPLPADTSGQSNPEPSPMSVAAPRSNTSVPQPAVACVRGEEMANKMGWEIYDYDPSVTTYGGVRIRLDDPATLPPGWEAITQQNVTISAASSSRMLPVGVSSIYPPLGECRRQLGVSG